MTVLQEGKHAAEFLLSEANGSLSREEVVISSTAAAMVPGTVLGKITATGEYVAYNNANADGSEVAAAILYRAAKDSAADQKAVVIARFAEVKKDELTGIDAAGEADLLALGIRCR